MSLHPPRHVTVPRDFATELADIAADLRRGRSCLVVCDKDLTPFLYLALRDRLRAFELPCDYADGRPRTPEGIQLDPGVMQTMLAQIRQSVRRPEIPRVLVLPYLDVMAAELSEVGPVARELIPMLFEATEHTLLGFIDPTLPLLPVLYKRFEVRYTLARRTSSTTIWITLDDPPDAHESPQC